MTHIWQGVQAGLWLTAAWPVRLACPSTLFASPAIRVARAAKERAGSAAAAVANIAQA
jgi:hypothetical protein